MNLQALLFDCDGVLAETERDGHRVAYNQALKTFGIEAEWNAEEYAELVLISGGKERLKYFFNKYPKKFSSKINNQEIIQQLYLKKTEIFKNMANNGVMPPRSGIARIAKEAHEAGVKLFICSTAHKESVEALVRHNYGEECLRWFNELFCGDDVKNKKPAPDIYLLAKDKYKLAPEFCFVVEDSRNGLLAARGAGMHCIITQSYYTTGEDFTEADFVVNCLGDPGGEKAHLTKACNLDISRGYITVSDLETAL
jgi:HAD superfamily hydrolase (TIGR01509 family)